MTQPNVVVIFPDQLRRDALGCYGNRCAVTPNIDRLAAEGCRFDTACSTYPVCVPFRFSLMTGQYAHSRNVPALHFRMDPDEHTLADDFNAAGYRTLYVGKWHLDQAGSRRPVPRERQGRWQRWLGFDVRNAPFDTHYYENDDPTPHKIEAYQTDGLFDLAMQEIDTTLEGGSGPFICVVSVEPPHFPYEVPDEYLERWKGRDIEFPPTFEVPVEYDIPRSSWPGDDTHTTDMKRERVRTYHAMIENLDDNVGKMMQFLETRKVLDNTIVVLFADHGEMGGAHALPTAVKSYPFEESIGIPLIVHDPRASTTRGRSNAEPVCTEDLYPTLCGLAGVRPGVSLPGRDVSPVVSGNADTIGRDAVLLEHVRDDREPAVFCHKAYRGIRTSRYKYVVLADEGTPARPWLLFDLQNDPYEQHNLVGETEHATLQAGLHSRLLSLLAESGDARFRVAPST